MNAAEVEEGSELQSPLNRVNRRLYERQYDEIDV